MISMLKYKNFKNILYTYKYLFQLDEYYITRITLAGIAFLAFLFFFNFKTYDFTFL